MFTTCSYLNENLAELKSQTDSMESLMANILTECENLEIDPFRVQLSVFTPHCRVLPR